MNERIKQLALKAGGGLSCIAEPLEHPWKFSERELEKFAELIVRECERVAKDPQWYGESPSNGWRNPIRHVCNVMKEHFGVEL